MSKTSPPPSLDKLNVSDDWMPHEAIEWLSSHKHLIIWSLGLLLALILLAYRLIVSHNENAERDFFRAQTAFTEFQQKEVNPQEQAAAAAALTELDTIMQRHPELKPKYEGSLAQTLLIAGKPDQAVSYADDIFNRTQPDHVKLYQDYSKTSLLIAQKKYQEALTQAQALNQEIEKATDKTLDSTLYVFNLIRLAMLNQQLGLKEEEMKIWIQVQNLPAQSESAATVSQALMIGQASLSHYIDERKKAHNRD